MSAVGKVAIEGYTIGLLSHAEARAVLQQELGVEDKKASGAVVVALEPDEAKTLTEYLSHMGDAPLFRLTHKSLYHVNSVIKGALAA